MPDVTTASPPPPARAPGDAQRAAADTLEPGTAAPAQAVTGTISDDVRARIRQRQRTAGRVIARELPPTRPPREPGSLLVVIASAILVLALLVALAVIFRRLPTAPW